MLLSAANLLVTAAVAPATLTTAEISRASWDVTNRGTETAGASWSDGVYLSRDAALDGDDVLLGDGLVAAPSTLAPGASYNQQWTFTVPATDSGDYYLLFAADSGGNQAESSEADNVRAVPVNVIGSPPDLIVDGATAPSSAKIGPVDVSWTVKNQGIGSAPNSYWYDYVYLSTDDTYDFFDTPLTSAYVSNSPPLVPGGTYARSLTVSIPSVAAGDYYLLFAADASHHVTETNEANNVLALPITLSIPDIDLTVTSADAPSTVNPGGTVSVSWTVANQGTDPAPNGYWYDYVYLLTDGTYDGSDYYLTSTYISNSPPLAAGGDYTRSLTVSIPSVTAGDYYLLFAADASHDVTETDETNNVLALPITLSPSNVDLAVTSANAAPSGDAGGTAGVSWTVTNLGTDPVPNIYWYDYIYLSSDDTYDGADRYVASSYVYNWPQLAAGGSYTNSLTVSIPSVAAGDYYLLFVADGSHYVAEGLEANNVLALPITLSAPNVNLVVTSATAPDSALTNGTAALSWTVTNQGTAPASNSYWYDYVYLSPDDTYDGSDDFLTSAYVSSSPPLAAGGSYTRSQSVAIPGLTAGDYYLLFVADGSHYLAESLETNNILALPITLSAPIIDLAVTSATAPSMTSPGGTASVSWTVTNQGSDPLSAGYWYDYVYLSTNDTFDDSDEYVGYSYVYTNPPLVAGGTYTEGLTVSIPWVDAGAYYLLFVADGSHFVTETDETNNVLALPLTLAIETDLAIDDASAPESGTAGQYVTVSWSVSNVGAAAASANWLDAVYLSTDDALDPASDIMLSSISIASQSPLSDGIGYIVSMDVFLPDSVATGDYFLLIAANSDDGQAESSRSNNVAALRFAVERTASSPATVSSFQVNDGEAQRSMVTHLTLTFSGVVTIGSDAFVLTRSDGTSVGVVATSRVEGGRTVVALTFSGEGIVAGSLADGRYTLTLLGDQIRDAAGQALDGDGDGEPGGDYVDHLFRFFGDADGDGDVDNLDYFALRATVGKSAGEAGYAWYLDADGDGSVDLTTDYSAFKARYRKTLA